MTMIGLPIPPTGLSGITVTGTPSAGEVLTATSATAAGWAAPSAPTLPVTASGYGDQATALSINAVAAFAPIGGGLTAAIAAAVGDVLVAVITGQFVVGANADNWSVDFAANGTHFTEDAANDNQFTGVTSTSPQLTLVRRHVVVAGDIVAGSVTVTAIWKLLAGTSVTLTNNGNNKPLLLVVNMRH